MSPEAIRLLSFMLKSLTSCKYLYSGAATGCYEMAVNNRGYSEPPEGKEFVIEKINEALVNLGYSY